MRSFRYVADRLLQTRYTAYNGTLGNGLGERFQTVNDTPP